MQPFQQQQQRHQPQGSLSNYDAMSTQQQQPAHQWAPPQAQQPMQHANQMPQHQQPQVDQYGQPLYNDTQRSTSQTYQPQIPQQQSFVQPQMQQQPMAPQSLQQRSMSERYVPQQKAPNMGSPMSAQANRMQPQQQWQQAPQYSQQQQQFAAPQQQVLPQQPVPYAQPQMAPQQPVYMQPQQPTAPAPMYQPEYVPEQQVTPIIGMPPQQHQPQQQQLYQGFRPPYADDNVRTGFSGVYAKPLEEPQLPYDPYQQQHQQEFAPVQHRMPLNQRPEEIIIEPTETDINQSDLDEGTVIGAQTNPRRRPQQQNAQVVSPRRLNFNRQSVNPQEQMSPRVSVARTDYQPPHDRIQREYANRKQMAGYDDPQQQQLVDDVYVDPVQFLTQAERDQGNLSGDEWKSIQKRIDTEYEKKLKQVGDDALQKLRMFQAEHKALLEKTQYLIDQQAPLPSTNSVNEQRSNRAYQPVRAEDAETDNQQWQRIANVQNIRNFHKEYNEVINYGLNVAGELYLVDILKRLHLLPAGDLLPTKEHERELYNLLGNSKDNLLIRSDLEQENDQTTVQDLEGDLTRNLFKICCAILNLTVNQRGHNALDERLLMSYLGSINYTGQEDDETPTPGGPTSTLSQEHCLIPVPLHLKEQGQAAGFEYDESEMVRVSGYTVRDQLACIKSLINRPSYSLNDRQIRLICDAFQNFADNRQRFLEINGPQPVGDMSRVLPPQTPPQYQQQQNQPVQQRNMQPISVALEPSVDPRYSAKGPQRMAYNPDIEHQKNIDRQLMQARQMGGSPQYANSEAQPGKQGVRPMGQVVPPLQQQQAPRHFNTATKQQRYQPAPQQTVQQFAPQARPMYGQQQKAPYEGTAVNRQVSPHIQVRNIEPRMAPARGPPVAVNDIDDPLNPVDAFDQQKSSDAQQLSFGTSTRQRRNNPVTAQSELGGRNRSVPRNQYQPVPTTTVPNSQQAQRRLRDRSANAAQRQPVSGQVPNAQYRANTSGKQRPRDAARRGQADNQFDEEPICVLKVELDGGDNVQHITVYEGEVAEDIVEEFGRKFNLSENAKSRLLQQINQQIAA